MKILTLKQEESRRFNDSPYVYALSLFLIFFGLIACVWHITDLLTISSFNFSYSIVIVSALVITVLLLVFLDRVASKLASPE
ncbi:hypothetical protein AADZ86_11245 [Colwelliaceae bacterium BS250]